MLTPNSPKLGAGTVNSTSKVSILTAPANGTRVDYIDVKATGATTAGQLQLYVNVGGTDYLWMELEVTVVSSAPWFELSTFINSGLLLEENQILKAALSGSIGTINVLSRGGDLSSV